MKKSLKKITKKHIVAVGSLCLILLAAISLAATHTTKETHSKANKAKTTQTTKKKESSSSSSSSSSSVSSSSQSSSEATSEVQQAETPAAPAQTQTQTEQAPAQEYAQPDDSCYPNGFQSDYFVSPDDGSNATPSQDWHDDQVEWARQQGYLDE